jgi:hypothetical protein
MRNRLLALLVLLVISSSTQGQGAGGSDARPFSISSLNTAFAMQGDFDGEYRIYPDRIELKFTKANISISEHCPYKGRRLLSAVKVGLATGTDNERWKIADGAQGFLLEIVMSPGDTHSLGELDFTIPKDASVDLSKHWLVVQMEDIVLDAPGEKRPKGHAYAHSCRDIFTRAK